MKKVLTYFFIFAILQGSDLKAQDISGQQNRKAAFAGSFYPADRNELTRDLESYFSSVDSKVEKGVTRALIVPHAGYTFSGKVLADGYHTIPSDATYKNIFIIASSHRVSFNGASVYAAGDYETPLGTVKVNRDIAGKLIEESKYFEFKKEAHLNEHSIEVQLPMIQYHFKNPVRIVPIVIGSQSPQVAREIAITLLPYFTPENLFIISSDFSHYPDYNDAVKVDKTTCEAILTNSPQKFYAVLRDNAERHIENLATSACGWPSILTLLYMTDAVDDIEFKPVKYMNSGDVSTGTRDRVVGYWAITAVEEKKVESGETGYLTEREKTELVDLARLTLESVVRNHEYAEINPGDYTGTLAEPAGAFVSLYMDDRLRGCIGQFEPDKPLYMVVQEMTAAAALNDHRFAPVEPFELNYIRLEISVLTPLRKITDISEFKLGKQGIYIVKDGKSGTYLPQVAEGRNWTAEEFISHCSKEKAGLGWEGWKDADLYVYEDIVFGEK